MPLFHQLASLFNHQVYMKATLQFELWGRVEKS